jgi:hypothetical protein
MKKFLLLNSLFFTLINASDYKIKQKWGALINFSSGVKRTVFNEDKNKLLNTNREYSIYRRGFAGGISLAYTSLITLFSGWKIISKLQDINKESVKGEFYNNVFRFISNNKLKSSFFIYFFSASLFLVDEMYNKFFEKFNKNLENNKKSKNKIKKEDNKIVNKKI